LKLRIIFLAQTVAVALVSTIIMLVIVGGLRSCLYAENATGADTQRVNVILETSCVIKPIRLLNCDLSGSKPICEKIEVTFRPGCGQIEVTHGK